jgi:ATP-binding cassette subfamily B protein RaxB
MIGVVLQDDSLFAGSIAENIAFFAAAPDMERIEAAARQAAVHDDIIAMPMGYGTLIGDMGTVLSGGQRQRVFLARALYRRPGLLLLDEATSHLDVSRERAVNSALSALPLTRIVVAHRPETISASERVITIEGGRIASDVRRGTQDADEHPTEDHRLSDHRRADAAQHRGSHLHLDQPPRLLLRPDEVGPRADGHGDPPVGAHEPVLREHRRAAAARKDRAG